MGVISWWGEWVSPPGGGSGCHPPVGEWVSPPGGGSGCNLLVRGSGCHLLLEGVGVASWWGEWLSPPGGGVAVTSSLGGGEWV